MGQTRIALQTHSEGVVLLVRAVPGARRDEIRGEQAGALKVAVTQPAEKGKANQAIVRLLARRLGVKRNQIALLSGATSHDKRLLITGMTIDELSQRLEQLLANE